MLKIQERYYWKFLTQEGLLGEPSEYMSRFNNISKYGYSSEEDAKEELIKLASICNLIYDELVLIKTCKVIEE